MSSRGEIKKKGLSPFFYTLAKSCAAARLLLVLIKNSGFFLSACDVDEAYEKAYFVVGVEPGPDVV